MRASYLIPALTLLATPALASKERLLKHTSLQHCKEVLENAPEEMLSSLYTKIGGFDLGYMEEISESVAPVINYAMKRKQLTIDSVSLVLAAEAFYLQNYSREKVLQELALFELAHFSIRHEIESIPDPHRNQDFSAEVDNGTFDRNVFLTAHFFSKLILDPSLSETLKQKFKADEELEYQNRTWNPARLIRIADLAGENFAHKLEELEDSAAGKDTAELEEAVAKLLAAESVARFYLLDWATEEPFRSRPDFLRTIKARNAAFRNALVREHGITNKNPVLKQVRERTNRALQNAFKNLNKNWKPEPEFDDDAN